MRTVLASLTLFLCANALGDRQIYEHLEEGAEIAKLQLSASAQQLVYARLCDNCEMLALSVDGQTLFFDHKRPITVAAASQLADRSATVFFERKSRLVTRIVFWKSTESEQ